MLAKLREDCTAATQASSEQPFTEQKPGPADRQKYRDKWGKDNHGRLADFRTNRGKNWNGVDQCQNVYSRWPDMSLREQPNFTTGQG